MDKYNKEHHSSENQVSSSEDNLQDKDNQTNDNNQYKEYNQDNQEKKEVQEEESQENESNLEYNDNDNKPSYKVVEYNQDNQLEEYKQKYKKAKRKNHILTSLLIGIIIGSLITTGIFLSIENQREYSRGSTMRTITISGEYEEPVVAVADKVLPSIVMIKNNVNVDTARGATSINRGTGSGIIYSSDGYIITNQHVINGASDITVTLYDGRDFNARVIGQDARSDLAVLKIDGKDLVPGDFGDSKDIRVGELAVAIGNPMGEEFSGSVTAGIISATDRSMNIGEKRLKLFQTDAAINPGNSGGALVNKKGEVIGINSVKLSSPNIEGMGFAIPINDALPIIEELISHGYVKRPWIGVGIGDVTEDMIDKHNFPRGVYIVRVYHESPAEKAGLKVDDIITEVNGKRVYTAEALINAISELKPDTTINMKIYRNNTYEEVEITIGVMPSS